MIGAGASLRPRPAPPSFEVPRRRAGAATPGKPATGATMLAGEHHRSNCSALRGCLENCEGYSPGAEFLIQALDVDRAEPWPDGQDRQEDQALPV